MKCTEKDIETAKDKVVLLFFSGYLLFPLSCIYRVESLPYQKHKK
jgi:hypothetical protein